MSRMRRFLHLERPRSEPIAPEAAPSSRGRFGAVDATADEVAAAAPAAPPGDAGARFSEPPLRAPDVAAPPAPEAQPFVRCFRCETDNSLYAERCTTCGTPLDTPDQRRFNERLWAERRAEAQTLDDEVRRLRENAARAEEEAWRARRQMGEVIAREVGRRERERLDREAPGWGGAGSGGWSADGEGRWGSGGEAPGPWGSGDALARDRRPLGIRLLFGIQDPGRRLIAIAAVVAVFVFLVAAAFMSPSLSGLLWVAMFLFAVFFAPRRRRWRW